ncbi:MAG: hypothetical protein V3W14_00625 [Candidatus Neomarinimicrobiota bacterium]
MTTFPGSPRVQKGAIVGIDPLNPLASIIVFQYNPIEMTRVITARTMGGNQGPNPEALRLTGAPKEKLTVDVKIDAIDQLEKGESIAGSMGIYPQLSALEMLLYPKSLLVIANMVLANLGTIEIVPPEAPMTLFIWGIKRVVPVRLTGFTIMEKAFDPSLNPIRASVKLDLDVLSYSDLPSTHPGSFLFMAHQVAKEAMAVVGSVSNAGNLGQVF